VGPSPLNSHTLPDLALADWRPTRDALWTYARWLGAIRSALTPPARHWGHVSLRVSAHGLTTGPIIVGPARFELALNLDASRVELTGSTLPDWSADLAGVSSDQILDQVNRRLSAAGQVSALEIPKPALLGEAVYQPQTGQRFWGALSALEAVFGQFAGGLRGEVHGPQLWPHHFDLAVLWLSGRQIEGQDPNDADRADENMNFGFSTGDEGIPDPYFYVTAYPAVDALLEEGLPAGARAHSEGWHGVRLDYSDLRAQMNPLQALSEFLSSQQSAGARAMALRAASPPQPSDNPATG
jgi:Family of unknown function (DUF5996)